MPTLAKQPHVYAALDSINSTLELLELAAEHDDLADAERDALVDALAHFERACARLAEVFP